MKNKKWKAYRVLGLVSLIGVMMAIVCVSIVDYYDGEFSIERSIEAVIDLGIIAAISLPVCYLIGQLRTFPDEKSHEDIQAPFKATEGNTILMPGGITLAQAYDIMARDGLLHLAFNLCRGILVALFVFCASAIILLLSDDTNLDSTAVEEIRSSAFSWAYLCAIPLAFIQGSATTYPRKLYLVHAKRLITILAILTAIALLALILMSTSGKYDAFFDALW